MECIHSINQIQVDLFDLVLVLHHLNDSANFAISNTQRRKILIHIVKEGKKLFLISYVF
jgi:hypothetical protein